MSLDAVGNFGTNFSDLLSGTGGNATPDEVASSIFDSIDSGQTGVITQTEFEQAFASLDLPLNVASLGPDAIFSQLDPNGTGRVLRDDFVSGLATLLGESSDTPDPSLDSIQGSGWNDISSLFAAPSADDSSSDDATDAVGSASAGAADPASFDAMLEAAFAAVDTAGTGYVTEPELAAAFGALQLPPTISALGPEGIFQELDPNFTGEISQDDFVSGLASLASSLTADQAAAIAAAASPAAASGVATDLSQELSAAFAAVDTQNSGYITEPQLAQVFGSLQLPATVAALGPEGIFAELDPNFTGQISQSDFVSKLSSLAQTLTVNDAAAIAAAAGPAPASAAGDQADVTQALTQAFAAVDTAGNGYITEPQLAQAFASLQLPAIVSTLGPEGIFAELDPNFTGQISQSDFVSGLATLASTLTADQAAAIAAATSPAPVSATGDQAEVTAALTQAFAAVDTAGNGYITEPQLAQAFASLQLPAVINTLGPEGIFAQLDPNFTGQISQSDFVSGLASLAQTLTSDDAAAIAAAAAGTAPADTSGSGTGDLSQFFTTVFASISGGDGYLTEAELTDGFASLQLPASLSTMPPGVLFAQLDPYQTGLVSESDFVSAMTAMVTAATTPAATAATDPTDPDWSAMFDSIDTAGTGVVSLRQFEAAFGSLQLPAAIAAAGPDAVFQMMDPDETGEVTQAAFVAGITTLSGAANYFGTAFASVDSDGNGVVTLDELAQAFGSLELPASVTALGAGTVYGELDPYYTGQVSLDDFVAGMTALVASASASDDDSQDDPDDPDAPGSTIAAASAASLLPDANTDDASDAVPDGLTILNSFYASRAITANSPTMSPLLDPQYAQFVL